MSKESRLAKKRQKLQDIYDDLRQYRTDWGWGLSPSVKRKMDAELARREAQLEAMPVVSR